MYSQETSSFRFWNPLPGISLISWYNNDNDNDNKYNNDNNVENKIKSKNKLYFDNWEKENLISKKKKKIEYHFKLWKAYF